MNLEERLERFRSAIEHDVEKKKKTIEHEMEEKKTEAMRKVDDDIDKQHEDFLRNETDKIKTEGLRKISEGTIQLKKELMLERKKLVDSVFSEANEKIKLTVGSGDYYIKLQKKLDNALKHIDNLSDSVIYISAADAEKMNLHGLSVSEKSFELGGFEIVADKGRGFIDCTLKTALEEQREQFINKFGIGSGESEALK